MRKPSTGRKSAPAKFEGSPKDRQDDKKNAKKLGMPLKAYERSAFDKKKDAEGQKKLDAKRKGK